MPFAHFWKEGARRKLELLWAPKKGRGGVVKVIFWVGKNRTFFLGWGHFFCKVSELKKKWKKA